MPSDPVLVAAVDDTSRGEQVLRAALDVLSHSPRAVLHVVRVDERADPGGVIAMVWQDAATRSEVIDALRELTSSLGAEAVVGRVEFHGEPGQADSVVPRLCKSLRADVLFVGARGLALPSASRTTYERIAARVACSVMIVREAD